MKNKRKSEPAFFFMSLSCPSFRAVSWQRQACMKKENKNSAVLTSHERKWYCCTAAGEEEGQKPDLLVLTSSMRARKKVILHNHFIIFPYKFISMWHGWNMPLALTFGGTEAPLFLFIVISLCCTPQLSVRATIPCAFSVPLICKPKWELTGGSKAIPLYCENLWGNTEEECKGNQKLV